MVIQTKKIEKLNQIFRRSRKPFHYALNGNNIELLKILAITKKVDKNQQDRKGNTPLHLAVTKSNLQYSEILLNIHVDMNVLNKSGNGPLHVAIKNGNLDMVNLLLNYGCNINIQNRSRNTPLHLAVIHKMPELLNLLLKRGADSGIKNNNGNYPIHEAIINEDYESTQSLIYFCYPKRFISPEGISHMILEVSGFYYRCDINRKNHMGKTALLLAIEKHLIDIVELFVTYLVCNYDICDKFGNTPLHIAAAKGYTDILNILIKENCTVNVINHYRETPIANATLFNHYRITEQLLISGANPNIVDRDGKLPTHLLTNDRKSKKILKILIKYGTLINYPDYYGFYPLHYACRNHNDDIARILLQNDADLNVTTKNSQTILDLAIKSKINNKNVDKTLRILVRFILLNIAKKRFVVEKIIKQMYDNEIIFPHRMICIEELNNMKKTTIEGTNINYFNFITEDTEVLARFVKNKHVRKWIKINSINFPEYELIIRKNLKNAIKRRKSLDVGIDFLTSIDFFKSLPYNCLDNVMSYLPNDFLNTLKIQ